MKLQLYFYTIPQKLSWLFQPTSAQPRSSARMRTMCGGGCWQLTAGSCCHVRKLWLHYVHLINQSWAHATTRQSDSVFRSPVALPINIVSKLHFDSGKHFSYFNRSKRPYYVVPRSPFATLKYCRLSQLLKHCRTPSSVICMYVHICPLLKLAFELWSKHIYKFEIEWLLSFLFESYILPSLEFILKGYSHSIYIINENVYPKRYMDSLTRFLRAANDSNRFLVRIPAAWLFFYIFI